MSAIDLLRKPDAIVVQTDEGFVPLARGSGGVWGAASGAASGAGDIQITTDVSNGALAIAAISPRTSLLRIHLRWREKLAAGMGYLGDHWERGYGDLGWRTLVPQRVMPWYFLAYDGDATHGFGVKTAPAALCFWRADDDGISLWLDVRCGGMGVQLGQRKLRVAEVVSRPGRAGESPFQAARALCKLLCERPRLPDHPVYGSNNWYYAYGKSSHQQILHDVDLLMAYTLARQNLPYMVIDAGWQPNVIGNTSNAGNAGDAGNACAGGPWDRGNPLFPDMPGLAKAMRAKGARPGIWVRPLAADPDTHDTLLLPAARVADASAAIPILDPSIAENLARVETDVRRVAGWGYTLVKHDFSTCDILGRWGFAMGAEVTNGGWSFADRSRTTAEIILDFYQAVRRGAGNAVVIGCNTIGHLGAGLFELQRTGDDTSGMDWERTRKMGVNTLAFRMPQHGAFFAVDADCVGLTKQVPWALNRQWLDLLARSGTPLFVSAALDAIGPAQAAALKEAFAFASMALPSGEPLDWLDTTTPRRWKLGGDEVSYDWFGANGIETI